MNDGWDEDPFDLDEPQELVLAAATGVLGGAPACATCGRELGDDPEDEPDGDAGLPICGECNRSRNFDLFLHDGR